MCPIYDERYYVIFGYVLLLNYFHYIQMLFITIGDEWKKWKTSNKKQQKMAQYLQFQQFYPDTEPATISQRWIKWIKRFENFLITSNITANARKWAVLPHLAGERVYEIYDSLLEATDADSYDDVKTKLTQQFQPQKNTEYQILLFRRSEQTSDETLDQFLARFRSLCKDCEFENVEKEIKRQLF